MSTAKKVIVNPLPCRLLILKGKFKFHLSQTGITASGISWGWFFSIQVSRRLH